MQNPNFKRNDGRRADQLRNVQIVPNPTKYAEGSVLIKMGDTHVLCTASVDPSIPKWLSGQGRGWVTAEYGMLPRSTHTRVTREKATNSGRSQEISRLIARSLRAGVDLKALGERQITVDCDVLQADGGTRTAAITGGYVALAMAISKLKFANLIAPNAQPLLRYVSAISVGLDKDQPLLDLCYDEDVKISTDMNLVMTEGDEFVEVQGTAEGAPFSRALLTSVLDLAQKGCRELFIEQSKVIGSFFPLKSQT